MLRVLVFASASRGAQRAEIRVVELPNGRDEVQWLVGARLVLSRTCTEPDDVVAYVQTLRTDMAGVGWVFDDERRH